MMNNELKLYELKVLVNGMAHDELATLICEMYANQALERQAISALVKTDDYFSGLVMRYKDKLREVFASCEETIAGQCKQILADFGRICVNDNGYFYGMLLMEFLMLVAKDDYVWQRIEIKRMVVKSYEIMIHLVDIHDKLYEMWQDCLLELERLGLSEEGLTE